MRLLQRTGSFFLAFVCVFLVGGLIGLALVLAAAADAALEHAFPGPGAPVLGAILFTAVFFGLCFGMIAFFVDGGDA